MNQQEISTILNEKYAHLFLEVSEADMLTVEVHPASLKALCYALRDDSSLQFDQLMDVCGVDYQDYGLSYWRQESETTSGYSRGVAAEGVRVHEWNKSRFASVYHLLSIQCNHRIRLKVFLEESPVVESVVDVWPSANWFERESFDLFGIFYEGHPDLRRLLTDYGFKGHPFRKDFPLIGEVEMRYDATQEACVYEPVSIQPRVLVPKVIRQDNRYLDDSVSGGDDNA